MVGLDMIELRCALREGEVRGGNLLGCVVGTVDMKGNGWMDGPTASV